VCFVLFYLRHFVSNCRIRLKSSRLFWIFSFSLTPESLVAFGELGNKMVVFFLNAAILFQLQLKQVAHGPIGAIFELGLAFCMVLRIQSENFKKNICTPVIVPTDGLTMII
jgi:hypothetical protein